ncbi:hypothetical protein HCG51_17150 [Tolypothrix sp. PCC 7910]|uniref:hypothetical protein n=1 Tax=Tolypothrix sp. PCC 7910 TaxID=2099387 RepID=UPI001427744B|nr:hypothetical protein [Tolypothrix sp. PCC 7910]QIR38261.1 hypothetical protein HCG51_17150 [Tolypothrix sp. PCC 7910]
MARAIERIDRDIALLKEAIAAIATELKKSYAIYLTLLGQAVRQQLILATYHLCTQGYPEKFLSLSLNQRHNLQQAIRKLGKQAGEQLLAIVSNEENQNAVAEDKGDELDEDDEADEADEADEGDEVDAKQLPDRVGDEEDEVDKIDAGGHRNAKSQISTLKLTDPSNPMQLLAWQQSLEKLTQYTLKKLSHDANTALQKVNILPNKIPEPILEVAAAASEASAEVMPGPPNILNVVIEIPNEQDVEESSLTKVMAINLRLGEIEFADAKLSSARRQIRNTLIQLKKLGQDYQKKQRERLIAEAEAAWRAIWDDD